MAFEFLLPDIGEGLTEAEIVRWLVAVGDHVREDDPFVEIQTDKAITEMPSPATGVVVRLGAAVGEIVNVGEVLVVIDGISSTDTVTAMPTAHGEGGPVELGAGAGQPRGASSPGRSEGAVRRPLASPATRGLARRLGVDLTQVTGSGPGGRITDADVEGAQAVAPGAATSPTDPISPIPPAPPPPRRASAASPMIMAATAEDRRVPFRGIRRRTAETLLAAWQQVPHVSSFQEVDATDLMDLRRRLMPRAEADGVQLTLTAFFVRATALGLRAVPAMNATLDAEAGEIILRGHVNVAVAVDTDDGLILPVVRDADTKGVLAIAAELQGHVEAARARRLDLAAMSASTFTISNFGPIGGWFGTSLVRNGEVGVLGFGPAQDKPAVVGGQIAVRKLLVINAGADHRVVDGREIIGFCTAVRQLLEDPLSLLAMASW